MRKEHINVIVKVDDIERALISMIDHRYKKEISAVIMNNLTGTELGVEQLYASFSGIVPRTDYKVGDKVLVDIKHLPSWRIDFDKTKEAGFVYQGKIKGVVESIDLSKTANIRVNYKFVDKSDGKIKTEGWPCNEADIILANEEQVDYEDDLPF